MIFSHPRLLCLQSYTYRRQLLEKWVCAKQFNVHMITIWTSCSKKCTPMNTNTRKPTYIWMYAYHNLWKQRELSFIDILITELSFHSPLNTLTKCLQRSMWVRIPVWHMIHWHETQCMYVSIYHAYKPYLHVWKHDCNPVVSAASAVIDVRCLRFVRGVPSHRQLCSTCLDYRGGAIVEQWKD